MKMYFVLPATSIYESQERVSGHRHTPLSRESLRALRDLVPRLRDLGIHKVISSDLDEQSAALLGRRLNVPVDLWPALRRFNWGKLHGTKACKAQEVYDSVQSPEVPVKGGDSRMSWEKRLAAARVRLLNLRDTAVIVADAQVIAQLIGARAALEHNHIYEFDTGGLQESPAMYRMVANRTAGAGQTIFA